MISAVLVTAASAWWSISTSVLLLSFVAVLAHPLRRRRPSCGNDLPRLTAIVPIKSVHAGFESAQRSLFAQNYPGLEIELVAAETTSPAVAAAQRIQREFPGVASRMLRSDGAGAASPKLGNLWPAIREARNDLLLAKDSNLTLEPGELEALVRCVQPGIGLVSTIPIAIEPRSLAAWVEASIINCYHARVLMLADAAGLGFGLGKIMLFRRSDLMRAGGFASLSWALGEDMALAQAMNGLGLRTVLADRVSHQALGRRRFSDMWQRQLRWMVIWRVQLPGAFLADLLGSALPTAAAGAWAAAMLGYPAFVVFAATLAAWFCLESVLCLAKGWPLSIWSPVAFAGREILAPFLWFRACTTDTVIWEGQPCRAQRRPKFENSVQSGNLPARPRGCDR